MAPTRMPSLRVMGRKREEGSGEARVGLLIVTKIKFVMIGIIRVGSHGYDNEKFSSPQLRRPWGDRNQEVEVTSLESSEFTRFRTDTDHKVVESKIIKIIYTS